MDKAANSRSHQVSRGQEEEDLHRDFTSGRPTALRKGLPGFKAVLVIPELLLDRILTSARSGAPEEVCGWLAGEGGRVEQIYPVPNVAESGFRMHPEAQLSAMREIREAGLDLVGTYHSHPRTPARPSARDLQLGSYPDCLHLIVSLVEPAVRAFRISDETARDVEVVVKQSSIIEPAIYRDCEEAGPGVD